MSKIFWSEYLKGRDHSKDLGVNGKIILEWILRERSGLNAFGSG
jgi:hypothetical protein